MEEIWKDIPGYEGRYQVSDQGRVRSVDRVVQSINRYTRQPFDRHLKGQILRPGRFTSSGHVSVVLGHGAHGSPVHQLVMLAFVGPCPKDMEICHNNGDASDNRLENLRYDTRSENMRDIARLETPNKRRVLTKDLVYAIREDLASGATVTSLAKKYNVSMSSISALKRGITFQYI